MSKVKLKDLIPDERNANRHTEYGTGLLENSTRENGFGRSILISADNKIIAGNGVANAGAAIGMDDVQIVESDGKKIIAVKRTDIKSGTPEFFKMALADNIVAEKNIEMDAEIVQAIIDEFPETTFWGSIVTEEPNTVVDKDKAGIVHVSFQLTGAQAAKVKQAIKIAKQINKGKKNANDNGSALVTMSIHFTKTKGK